MRIFTFIQFIFLSLAVQASAQDFTLDCKSNELSFKVQFENEAPVEIKFSKRGGGSNLTNDLLGGKSKLYLNNWGTNNETYASYKGEIKVPDTDSFFRTVEVSFKKSELANNDRMTITMAPGDTHWAGSDESTTFAMWSWDCKKVF